MTNRSSRKMTGGAGGHVGPAGLDLSTAHLRRSALAIDVNGLLEAVVPPLALRLRAQRSERRLVETFADLLISEHDDRFERFFLDHAGPEEDPQVVAETLLAPAARLIGDYWRMDICDFMRVTVAMTRLQRLFWMLASLHPPEVAHRPGRTALLSPVPGEEHSFGLSVVEDALRRDGWLVDRCSVDEEEMFFELLGANDYAVVGLSLSGSARAASLSPFIKKARARSRNVSARILAGGSLFVEKPEFAFEAGADLLATDAQSAVRLAEAAAGRERDH